MLVKVCIWALLSGMIIFSFFAVHKDNEDSTQISGFIALPAALVLMLIFIVKGVLM